MFHEYFAGSEQLIWPLLGLIIFGSIFIGVLAYVFLGLRDPEKLKHISSLPLAADDLPNLEPNLVKPAEGGPGQ